MAEKQKNTEKLIDFGFERVTPREKKQRVSDVFDSVADRYDLMNDLMSLGLHRAWKRFALTKTALQPGGCALDVAAGSGDLSERLARQVGPEGRVVVSDFNSSMLHKGRARLIDAGLTGNVLYLQADAEKLPLRPRLFDCVTIGFGLRNVADKSAALAEMFRVIKPGGRLLILEFSQPRLGPLDSVYDFYSFRVLPRLGQSIVGDDDSYRYLVESIRVHPDQDALKKMMVDRGFERCEYYNLSGGIVALHVGLKL